MLHIIPSLLLRHNDEILTHTIVTGDHSWGCCAHCYPWSEEIGRFPKISFKKYDLLYRSNKSWSPCSNSDVTWVVYWYASGSWSQTRLVALQQLHFGTCQLGRTDYLFCVSVSLITYKQQEATCKEKVVDILSQLITY